MPTHKKPESERYKGPAKYAEYLVGRAVVSTLQRLPIGFAYRLGRGTGWLAWKLMRRRRATVRKNLEIVNAWFARCKDGGRQLANGKDEPPTAMQAALSLEAQVREVFQRTGANLFAGFTFNRMSPEQAGRHIRIEGVEHLKAALEEGGGVIVLLAHMGPWETLAQLPGLAREHGIDAPFGAIYRKFNNAYLDGWFRRQREASGTRLFGSRSKFYAPVDFLRAGGMLGILADQRASGGERAAFFGLLTKVTPLPGLLQLRSKASLLALSISTKTACQWTLRIHPVEAGQADEDGKRRPVLAQATATAMESVLSRSPLDGFWFTDRFKDVNQARRTRKREREPLGTNE